MKLRKIFAIVLAGALVLAFAGTAMAGEGETKALKLASHNAVVEGNPYRVRYELDMQEAAADAINYG